jgi:Mn-dependent DtxR family transcriptional regulator
VEGVPMRNADLADAVGINKTYQSELLRKMAREGLVENVERGMWGLPENPNSPK